jgi:hypothetical protein
VRPIFDGSAALRPVASGYTNCENGLSIAAATQRNNRPEVEEEIKLSMDGVASGTGGGAGGLCAGTSCAEVKSGLYGRARRLTSLRPVYGP